MLLPRRRPPVTATLRSGARGCAKLRSVSTTTYASDMRADKLKRNKIIETVVEGGLGGRRREPAVANRPLHLADCGTTHCAVGQGGQARRGDARPSGPSFNASREASRALTTKTLRTRRSRQKSKRRSRSSFERSRNTCRGCTPFRRSKREPWKRISPISKTLLVASLGEGGSMNLHGRCSPRSW